MIILIGEEKRKITERLLENTKLQWMEQTMTREFNKKMAEENPQSKEKINGLNVVIEQDIKQTEKYIGFIEEELKKSKGYDT